MALQIRRGPNAQRATTLLQTGEVAWTTDTKKLYVGDGVTTGGVNILANIAGTGFVWNPSTEQLDLAGSTITGINADNVAETNGVVPRLWYRSSLGKTHASEIFTTVAGAAHSGISFSWDDVNQKLTATVLTENAADAAAALFTSGIHTGISFAYGLTEDAANRIDATVSSEYIQDTVNDLFTAGVHTGITFTYSDSLNALSAAVTFPAPGGNLGSNLVLNTFNISGTGNISNTGTMTATGNISTSAGSISANGSVSAGTTISATQGLGASLPLNSYNINGTGNISIVGAVSNGTLTLDTNVIRSTTLPAAYPGYTVNTTVSIGNNANPTSLAIVSTGAFGVMTGITTGTDVSGVVTRVSRGTLAIPTTVVSEDGLIFNQAMGYDGASYVVAGGFGMGVDRNVTVSTNDVPGNFVVFTVKNSVPSYMTFNSAGILDTPNLSTTGLRYYTPNYITVSTTTTYSLSATQSYNLLLVTAGSLTATINMPASPTDGQVTNISVLTNIVTLAVGTGTVSPSFAGSATAGTVYRYIYRATGTTWYRI
jgi:hypothetical protein